MFLSWLCGPASASIPFGERVSLIALYSSTAGADWTKATNWLGAAGTEGTWLGVTVKENHVIGLSLINNNLAGPIPADLTNLTELQYLHQPAYWIGSIRTWRIDPAARTGPEQ
jgi:hypothetical protein